MTSKKDDAIKNLMAEFEDLANLVLRQLDLLEKVVSSGETTVPDEIEREMQENEKSIDKSEVKLSDKIINTIVLYQPVASDIRKIIACYRIIINLERVSDQAMNILGMLQNIKIPEIFTNLSEVISNMLIQSSGMVNKALLAYTTDDREYAIWTIKNDAVIDELNQKMLKKAIKKTNISEENKLILTSFINLNSIVANIERIGDHATNIAEAAIYSIEGKDIRHNKKFE
jgi:phosphate transport system protein